MWLKMTLLRKILEFTSQVIVYIQDKQCLLHLALKVKEEKSLKKNFYCGTTELLTEIVVIKESDY